MLHHFRPSNKGAAKQRTAGTVTHNDSISFCAVLMDSQPRARSLKLPYIAPADVARLQNVVGSFVFTINGVRKCLPSRTERGCGVTGPGGSLCRSAIS